MRANSQEVSTHKFKQALLRSGKFLLIRILNGMDRGMSLVIILTIPWIVEILHRAQIVVHFLCIGAPFPTACRNLLNYCEQVNAFAVKVGFSSWIRDKAFVIKLFCDFHSLRCSEVKLL